MYSDHENSVATQLIQCYFYIPCAAHDMPMTCLSYTGKFPPPDILHGWKGLQKYFLLLPAPLPPYFFLSPSPCPSPSLPLWLHASLCLSLLPLLKYRFDFLSFLLLSKLLFHVSINLLLFITARITLFRISADPQLFSRALTFNAAV